MEVEVLVERMIAEDEERVLAAYRRVYALLPEVRVTPEMVRRQWLVERRGAVEILESRPEERAAVTERAYTELYRSCPWLNEYGQQPRDPAVEMGWLAGLLKNARRVYEIGSGGGGLIRWLAGLGHDCVGTEITAQRGRQHVSEGERLSWHSTDGVNLTRYEDPGSFDATVSIQVLEHIHPDDVPAHLREVVALLAPGGRYVFTTPHRWSGPMDLSAVFGLDRAVCHHLKEWTYRELVPLLFEAGFADVRAVYTPPLSLRQRLPMTNRAVVSGGFLRFLMAVEWAGDRLPLAGRHAAMRVLRGTTLLRNDIFLVATKPR